MAVANFSDFREERIREYLSDSELDRLRSIQLEKRQREYVLGRLTTKMALASLTNNLKFRDVSVLNEASGSPVIRAPLDHGDYGTSIAHTDEIVVSLVFQREFSFGIDIENLGRKSRSALKYIARGGETIPEDSESSMVAWTLKESLGKALKCGLRCPEELVLAQLQRKDSVFFCSYRKHPEFGGIARIYGNYSLAITYPLG